MDPYCHQKGTLLGDFLDEAPGDSCQNQEVGENSWRSLVGDDSPLRAWEIEFCRHIHLGGDVPVGWRFVIQIL